jgi:HPt (histidine-containing phosphotransfer) domain-containing protein
LEAGMNDHVTKPIDPDQLFSTLQKWIKPSEKRLQAQQLEDPVEKSESDKTASAKDELPEYLPGFDLSDGLNRLRGNKELYRKLLFDFASDYNQVANEIRQALDAEDFDQALSLVHNLKGLAGNLAATELQAAAIEMEKLVKGQPEQAPSDQELKQKYADLEKALNWALKSVQNMYPLAATDEEYAQLSPKALIAKTPEIYKDDAARILTAANRGDIEELTAIAKELKNRSDAYTPFSDKLVELAEDLDFEVIEELVSELKPSADIKSGEAGTKLMIDE